MKKINWLRLVLSVLLCQIAGAIGSLFTFSSVSTWYATLTKPSFGPPNRIFAPVWIILYTLMGISLYLVWQKGLEKKPIKKVIMIFIFQLAANSLWSILFFGLKNILLGYIEIIVLWILILITIVKFYKIDKAAGLILIPYFFWVSFATFLNYSILVLNR